MTDNSLHTYVFSRIISSCQTACYFTAKFITVIITYRRNNQPFFIRLKFILNIYGSIINSRFIVSIICTASSYRSTFLL